MWSILAGHWTVKLGGQNGRLLHWTHNSYECENQILEAFLMASHLYAKFDCPEAHQNCSMLATVHDCEICL